MAKIFPIHPARPELVCWGCDHYCPANNMMCGNGADRTQHPAELFGPEWASFGLDAPQAAPLPATAPGKESGGGSE